MRLALAAVAAAVVAGFCTLGAWQWSRAAWKEALLAERAGVLERRDARSLEVAFDATRAQSLDWSAGRGRFNERVLLLDNQQRDGRAGVRAYGVLETTAGPMLVELGWLPWGAQRVAPAVDLPRGDVDVSGVLVAPPSTGLAMGNGVQALEDSRYLLTRIDPTQLGGEIGLAAPLAARVLKLDPELPIGFTRDFDLLPNTLPPERHRGYAAQWYALAATVAIVWLLLTLRRRARGNRSA